MVSLHHPRWKRVAPFFFVLLYKISYAFIDLLWLSLHCAHLSFYCWLSLHYLHLSFYHFCYQNSELLYFNPWKSIGTLSFFFFFLSRSGHRFEPFLTKDLFGHTVARTLWYYSWVQVYLLVMLLNYFRHSDQTLNVNLKYAAWI